MSDTDEPDFYGVLASVAMSDGDAELRFHPFVFSAETERRPVFAVSFSGARFLEAQLGGLVDQEIEVSVSATRAELYDVFAGEMLVLEADAIAATWATYDERDFARQVRRVSAEHERLNGRLVQALGKERKLKLLTAELLRRAEIKAAASGEHRSRQAAAIEVLQRVAKELDDEV